MLAFVVLREFNSRIAVVDDMIARSDETTAFLFDEALGDMRRFFILLCILAAFPPLRAIDLPKPPPGFTWQEIPELKAALLKPDGWFYRGEEQKGTLAYFITKEDISAGGEFQTGLTVNVFHLKKDAAGDRGEALISKMASDHHVQEWRRPYGPFLETGCEFKDTDASGTITMHALTIANPKTNTLYLFIFESPANQWDEAWKLGKPIIDSIALDDGV